MSSERKRVGSSMNQLPIAYSKLSSNLSDTISRSANYNNALATALKILCEFIDWDYGEIWTLCNDSNILQISPIWYFYDRAKNDECRLSWQQFQLCSQEFTLHLGEGLPGRVCLSHRAEWIADVSSESEKYFLRNLIAKAFGVRTALGVPVQIEGKGQSVFVFFNSEIYTQDPDLMQFVETTALHFGESLSQSAIAA
jgi:hypothetical protein